MLIGFAGFAQSGKDTSFDILNHHGFATKRHAFADPIKNTCNALFGWDARHSYGELKEVETTVTMSDVIDNYPAFVAQLRQYDLLQFGVPSSLILDILLSNLVGDDFHTKEFTTSPRQVYQVFGTEVGRNHLHQDVWILITPIEDVCITDVRFHNECDYLNNKGAQTVRINREDATPIRPHESEAYIPHLRVQHEYDNDGSRYDLESWLINHFNINPGSSRLFPNG